MSAERLKAVLVDVLDDAGSASRHSSALLQAFALSGVFGLALHVVIVVRSASGANKEAGG